MPGYEAGNFDPPAPVARVEVSGPGGHLSDVAMLLDSGADASSVPRRVVSAVGGVVTPSSYELELLDGTRVPAFETTLTVRVAPFQFGGAYLVVEQEYGVLGRNLLRHLVLRLDGPRQSWDFRRGAE